MRMIKAKEKIDFRTHPKWQGLPRRRNFHTAVDANNTPFYFAMYLSIYCVAFCAATGLDEKVG